MTLFFEDIAVGTLITSPAEVVAGEEMLAFARAWDPLPVHVDQAAAAASSRSITAPGLYVLALKLRLIHRSTPLAVIASLGYDEIRFHLPVRAGDTLVLTQECLERRESRSKPDRGIVTMRYGLVNQDGALVMGHRDMLLVRQRNDNMGGAS